MRLSLAALLAGLVFTSAAADVHAQRFVYRNVYVVPAPYTPKPSPVYYGPGFQTAITTGLTPSVSGGYDAYYTTSTTIRPMIATPYVSVVWDPATLTYRYTTGTSNTPIYANQLPNYYTPSYYLLPNYFWPGYYVPSLFVPGLLY